MVRHFYKISPQIAQVLALDIRWQIMELLLNNESMYAKRIAKILQLSESKVHYHLIQLRDAGLITLDGIRKIKQGRAKLYKPVADQFLLSLRKNDYTNEETSFSNIFSHTFCQDGQFNGKIVVGSSEPHGKYDAISRDGFLAGEICWYLANHLPQQKIGFVPNFVCTDLDYEKIKGKLNTNLILIGGHITNTLTAYYNDIMKSKFNVYFVENKIVSENNDFSNPNHGLISLFRNPNRKKKWILILAGVRSLGTKASIYSIISDSCDVLEKGVEFTTILKGESSDNIHVTGVREVMKKSLKME
jgi:DNA-binding transcriptional ArsR family regulator